MCILKMILSGFTILVTLVVVVFIVLSICYIIYLACTLLGWWLVAIIVLSCLLGYVESRVQVSYN